MQVENAAMLAPVRDNVMPIVGRSGTSPAVELEESIPAGSVHSIGGSCRTAAVHTDVPQRSGRGRRNLAPMRRKHEFLDWRQRSMGEQPQDALDDRVKPQQRLPLAFVEQRT